MKTDITIAALQVDLLWENIVGNQTKFGNLIEDLDTNVDLVILPEMFTSGFTMNPEKVAEPMNGSTIAWMQASAAKQNISIMGSFIVKEDNNFFNRMVFVDSAGGIQFYDKRHLFRMGNEHNYYSSGDQRKVFTYKGWRILPQVCYDLRFPVWSRYRNDYDLMVYVASWPESRRNIWNVLLQARAIENQAYLVGVNRVGVDGTGLSYSGDSVILDPKGMVIAGAKRGAESTLVETLSLDELSAFRAKFPAWMDADDFSIE